MTLKNFLLFTKFRLSFLVVLSALSGYLFAGGNNLEVILLLMAGGSLVTAASNGANQIWERDLDKLMNRTSNRPIPSGHLSVQTAVVIVVLLFISGTTLLWMINLKSALLGVSAFLSYVFLYTPLKTRTPWAVFVGAFPEQFPPC